MIKTIYLKFLKPYFRIFLLVSWKMSLCLFSTQLYGDIVVEKGEGDHEIIYHKVDETAEPVKKMIIDKPFQYDYENNTIEKTAFEYALTVRTLNESLLKPFFEENDFEKWLKSPSRLTKDEFFLKADYSKFFQLILSPHLLRPENYVVEIRYYHSKKYPEFSSLTEMKKVNGQWKIK